MMRPNQSWISWEVKQHTNELDKSVSTSDFTVLFVDILDQPFKFLL